MIALIRHRIILHYPPELCFRNPRLEVDGARPVCKRPVGFLCVHESHVIQRLCRIQSELEGPKNQDRAYEHRSVPIEVNLKDHVCRMTGLPVRDMLTGAHTARIFMQRTSNRKTVLTADQTRRESWLDRLSGDLGRRSSVEA